MKRNEELANNPALQDEVRRMKSGQPYDAHTPEMRALRAETKQLLKKINITDYQTPEMFEAIRELLPNAAPDIYVEPPFYCDYGNFIYAGEGVYINFGRHPRFLRP